MKGNMGLSPGSLETRQRLYLPADGGGGNRRAQNHQVYQDVGKLLAVHIPERSAAAIWKFRSLKLIFFIIICGTLITCLCFPYTYQNDHLVHSGSRFVDVGWISERQTPPLDPRYVSNSSVNLDQISNSLRKIQLLNETMTVGLLNFNLSEVHQWRKLLPNSDTFSIELDPVSETITWEVLYPEWIDEEEDSETPLCPRLPDPKVPNSVKFDLVIVKLPCNKSSRSWSRDVARLHLQISAAKVAANFVEEVQGVHVMFITDWFPIPNLFCCKDLVVREGQVWIYRPKTEELREKLKLPIGSCELAVPLKDNVHQALTPVKSLHSQREAFATILHSAHIYVCGAIAAAQSLHTAGSTRDLVILVDDTISVDHRRGLELAGWKLHTIDRIRNPKAERDAYNEWNYSKFRLWQLTDYDKIIFIDADLLVLRRGFERLFLFPEISATGNNGTLFNSGVMVIEPSNCTFELLMAHIGEIESYNGGDQGYLNEVFTWWHRIPKRMNFLKHFWVGDPPDVKKKKTEIFGAEPPVLYVLHYLGLKPWLCFRDYDCNWNVETMQEFASDDAHARWWQVHDAMDVELQKFCLLRSKQKAALEFDRRAAEKAQLADGHWRRKIEDPRLGTCFEEFCFWESMLWHWGETNWTNGGDTGNPNFMLSL